MGQLSASNGDRRSYGELKVEHNKKGGSDEKKSFPLFATIMVLIVWTFFTILIVLFGFVQGARYGEVNADRHFFGLDSPRLLVPSSIAVADNVFFDWVRQTKKRHVVDRKISSISLADSLIGDPSDHIFMGVYERDALARKREAALHFYLAASNGHPDGYRLYKQLNVPTEDYEALYQQFVTLHQLNGDLGLERLGQYYLGKDVFRIARRMRTSLRFTEPNDYIWPRQEEAESLAYIHFQMAAICGLTSAYEWRAETARFYKFTEQRENALKQRANNELKALADQYKTRGRPNSRSSQDSYCQRLHLVDQWDRMRELFAYRAALRHEEYLDDWNGGHPCEAEGHGYEDYECDEFDSYISKDGLYVPLLDVPTFSDLIGELLDPTKFRDRDGGAGRRGRGPERWGRAGRRGLRGSPDADSPAYRNNPGGVTEEGTEGFVDDQCIEIDGQYTDCDERFAVLACSSEAKRQFNLGEADMAVGRTVNARNRLERAIQIGRYCNSEYAVLAGKRLAALNLTCEYTPRSLARISRGYYDSSDGGAIIDLQSRQRALVAKGHYAGPADGKYGPATRDAARKFQRELGFSETGDLTPIETVYLICSAAEVNADSKSTNTLGVMYIAGLGVQQSTDRGVYWLSQAADQGNTDAMFNLSLIYGTGTVLSSFRLCGNVENLARADSWLELAANRGHSPAQRLIRTFGADSPSERWRKIREDLELNDFYKKRLEGVGEACDPQRQAPE